MVDFQKGLDATIAYVKNSLYSLIDLEGPPPRNRHDEWNGVKLKRKTDGPNESVGYFVVTLAELAEKGELRCQRENDQSKLLRRDGTRKTPFELAMTSVATKKESADILFAELCYRRDNKLPLPTPVQKLRIVADYLQDLDAAGLMVADSAQTIKRSYGNKPKHHTTQERIVHFTAQWFAWIATMSIALAVTGSASIWGLGLAATLTYIATVSVKQSGLFDLAVAFDRDLSWFFSWELTWKDLKISPINSAKALLQLASIGLVMYFAVPEAWAFVFNKFPLAVLPITSNMGLQVATAIQHLAAFSLAATAAIGTWIGISSSQRYFWGLTFLDNQMVITPQAAKALPKVVKTPGQGPAPAPDLSAVNKLLEEAKLGREIKKLGEFDIEDYKSFISRGQKRKAEELEERPTAKAATVVISAPQAAANEDTAAVKPSDKKASI